MNEKATQETEKPTFCKCTRGELRMMGKRIVTVLLILLLLIVGQCSAETEDACSHQWVPYDVDTHGILPDEIVLTDVDDLYHVYTWYRPSNVCVLCGEREIESGSGPATPHSYTVTGWEKDAEGYAVRITMTCGVCAYTYVQEIPLQTIRDGSGSSCLQGSACDTRRVGYLYENGLIMSYVDSHNYPVDFEIGEEKQYVALLYGQEKNEYFLTSRVYCPVCGRPRNDGLRTMENGFSSNLNGVPVMEETYFLTDGVPENLPYQLFDRLRQEEIATQ